MLANGLLFVWNLRNCARSWVNKIQVSFWHYASYKWRSLQAGSKGLFFCKFVLIVKNLEEFEYLQVIKSKHLSDCLHQKKIFYFNYGAEVYFCYFSTMFVSKHKPLRRSLGRSAGCWRAIASLRAIAESKNYNHKNKCLQISQAQKGFFPLW